MFLAQPATTTAAAEAGVNNPRHDTTRPCIVKPEREGERESRQRERECGSKREGVCARARSDKAAGRQKESKPVLRERELTQKGNSLIYLRDTLCSLSLCAATGSAAAVARAAQLRLDCHQHITRAVNAARP